MRPRCSPRKIAPRFTTSSSAISPRAYATACVCTPRCFVCSQKSDTIISICANSSGSFSKQPILNTVTPGRSTSRICTTGSLVFATQVTIRSAVCAAPRADSTGINSICGNLRCNFATKRCLLSPRLYILTRITCGSTLSTPSNCVYMLTPAPIQPISAVFCRHSFRAASALTAPVRIALKTCASIIAMGILCASSNSTVTPVARGTPCDTFAGIAPSNFAPYVASSPTRIAAGSTFTTPPTDSFAARSVNFNDVFTGCNTSPCAHAANIASITLVANAISRPPSTITSSRVRNNISPGFIVHTPD